MRVLLLPFNVASDLSHKVRALRAIGVDARGLAFGGGGNIIDSDGLKVIPGVGTFKRQIDKLELLAYMYKWIKWADVVHWSWSFNTINLALDKRVAMWLGKPGVIQWAGSDIRIPEVESEINPYYAQTFSDGYEYQYESLEHSLANQQDFADVGFYPLEFIGMGPYIRKDLFPWRFRIWQSVVLADHIPAYPDPQNARPLVLHSPTAPVAKGTKFVLEAVERLKGHYDFDFKLVQGLVRPEALRLQRSCDVYIDQLIIGSHGSAAVEAMAFGKPVICYINQTAEKEYPADLPIVNANPDNIYEKLEELIKNADLRHDLGLKGRRYVEKYHADDKVARDLVRIYENVIERKAAQGRAT